MALKRPQSDCVEHSLEIQNLKKDMESVLRHEKKFTDSIDRFELVIADLNLTIKLLQPKVVDLPERVRKLEDKSLIIDFVNKLAWLIIGALIASYAGQIVFPSTKERSDYKIEKSK